MNSYHEIKIYTDGSCIGNPGPGGYAAIIHTDEAEKIMEKIIAGGARDTTNNRMEISAIIKALQWVSEHRSEHRAESRAAPIHIYSDSQLVVSTMTKNWKRKMNTDLWNELDAFINELTASGHEIKWHWVKAHATHRENNRVDKLALAQAIKFKRVTRN